MPMQPQHPLPSFSEIRAEHVAATVDAALSAHLKGLSAILIGQQPEPTWHGLVQAHEDLDQRLLAVLQPIELLAAQFEHWEVADAYDTCRQQVALHEAALEQNATLHGLLQQLQQSAESAGHDTVQRAALANRLRTARLAGAGYERNVLNRSRALQLGIKSLQAKFEGNCRAAQTAWSKDFTDEAPLAGLSTPHMQILAEQAQDSGQPGWRLTLDFPMVLAVLGSAHDRELREEVYLATFTQASDQGPQAGEHDNGPVIEQLLTARLALSQLFGHRSYAQRAMATRMFDDPHDVEDMLLTLLASIRPAARKELDKLSELASQAGAPALQIWDVDYYKERYRQVFFDVADSAVRDYFPIDAVLRGMAALVEQLFKVQMRECHEVDVWHPQVRVFELHGDSESLGHVYFDLYAREGKGPGVWMQGLRDRHRFADGTLQLPIAVMNCDFLKASAHSEALLNVDQLTNLLHEFGHALHHVLTRIEHGSVSGIKGVADDAVEFPSCLFEAWAREPECLVLMSAHYQTGEVMPAPFLTQILKSRQAFQALDMLSQLEFSLLDLRLHRQAHSPVLMPVVRSVLAEVQVLPTPQAIRYTHTFRHLFATQDYAAGYYTYVWSQVLAAETFARFKREGLLSSKVGAQLRELILGQGGTLPIGQLVEEFTGRKPGIEALLERMGITPV